MAAAHYENDTVLYERYETPIHIGFDIAFLRGVVSDDMKRGIAKNQKKLNFRIEQLSDEQREMIQFAVPPDVLLNQLLQEFRTDTSLSASNAESLELRKLANHSYESGRAVLEGMVKLLASLPETADQVKNFKDFVCKLTDKLLFITKHSMYFQKSTEGSGKDAFLKSKIKLRLMDLFTTWHFFENIFERNPQPLFYARSKEVESVLLEKTCLLLSYIDNSGRGNSSRVPKLWYFWEYYTFFKDCNPPYQRISIFQAIRYELGVILQRAMKNFDLYEQEIKKMLQEHLNPWKKYLLERSKLFEVERFTDTANLYSAFYNYLDHQLNDIQALLLEIEKLRAVSDGNQKITENTLIQQSVSEKIEMTEDLGDKNRETIIMPQQCKHKFSKPKAKSDKKNVFVSFDEGNVLLDDVRIKKNKTQRQESAENNLREILRSKQVVYDELVKALSKIEGLELEFCKGSTGCKVWFTYDDTNEQKSTYLVKLHKPHGKHKDEAFKVNVKFIKRHLSNMRILSD